MSGRAAIASAGERCEHCGNHDEPAVVSYFEVYRAHPEATFTVPALTNSDPPLLLRIAAVGGGIAGAAYANNHWIYEVELAGILVCSGADLRSGGHALTHKQIAAALAVFLADTDVPALHRHRERLSLWAYETDLAMTTMDDHARARRVDPGH